jgi:dihydroflavonol-4-reductase
MAGTLPAITFPDLGLNPVLVGDLATGVLLVHDGGQVGRQYNLGGEMMRMREAVLRAAAVAGRRPPRLTLPTWLLSAISPLGGIIGPAMGVAPNLREVIHAAGRVTYWTSDAKARTELGYAPHDFEFGLRRVLEGMTGGG